MISVARDDQGAIETIPCDEADDKHFYIDDKGVAIRLISGIVNMLNKVELVSLMANIW